MTYSSGRVVVVVPIVVEVLDARAGRVVLVGGVVVAVSFLLRSRSSRISRTRTRSHATTTAAINPVGRRDRRGDDAYTVIGLLGARPAQSVEPVGEADVNM